jgi:Leucine-rich repeat (LRR) protein
LTGSLPEELFPSDSKEGLKNLKILELQNNNLNGTLPEEIGNMTLLEKLYLNGNRFSGSIPAAIGEISNLRKFLPRNYLNSIRQLTFVFVGCLNLTGNDLTGIVPEELCS